MFSIFRTSKNRLTEQETFWLELFRKQIAELVPGEEFELLAEKQPDGKVKYELKTDSKRAMVAWSELQEALLAGLPGGENSQ